MADTDLEALLRLFAFDDCDMLWWRGADPNAHDGPLQFFVNVNDVFAWGTADVEKIDLPSDLQGLAQARADVGDYGWEWPTLWACRKRGQRPQGAQYKHIPEHLWPLFDACGPERETGLLNPKPHPSEKAGST